MCRCQGNQSLACILNISFFFILLALVGVKKIRNPERMVRIAVGYTGHAPPKSDDTDGNSKRHSNDLHTCLCMCWLTAGASIKAFWQDDVMWELRSSSHLLCNRSHLRTRKHTHKHIVLRCHSYSALLHIMFIHAYQYSIKLTHTSTAAHTHREGRA